MAYCGIGKIPKGKRRGNMYECLDQKQVRYYGKFAIDKKLLRIGATGIKSVEAALAKLKKYEFQLKGILKEYNKKSTTDKRKETLVKKRDKYLPLYRQQQQIYKDKTEEFKKVKKMLARQELTNKIANILSAFERKIKIDKKRFNIK